MRGWSVAGIGLSVALGAAATATEKPKKPAPPPPTPSAERNGSPASYRAPPPGQGYSAQSRRMADCLASYPGYDPRTDRIQVRPGVTRRCEL